MFHSIQSYPSTLKSLPGASCFSFLQNKAPASWQGNPALQNPALGFHLSFQAHLNILYHITIGLFHHPPLLHLYLCCSPLLGILLIRSWKSYSSFSLPFSFIEQIPYQTHYWETETWRERWLVLIWVGSFGGGGGDRFSTKALGAMASAREMGVKNTEGR